MKKLLLVLLIVGGALAAVRPARPLRMLEPLMDGLFLRALQQDGTGKKHSIRLARSALYIRAHWLRMPPLLLARHLTVKAFRRADEAAAAN